MDSEKLKNLFEFLIFKYNDLFWTMAVMLVLVISFFALHLFLEHKQNNDERWYSFRAVLHNGIAQFIVAAGFIFIVQVFLKEVLYIDFFRIYYVNMFWKLVLGIFVWQIIRKEKKYLC